MKNLSTQKLVVAGLLGAVCIVMGMTGLGMIPAPTPSGRATVMHIPVILAGILEGPLVGGLTGLIFGVYSFLTPSGLIPADPIVRILPRILIGLTSAWTFRALYKRQSLAAALAGIVGTVTNTIGFLGLGTLIGYLPPETLVLFIPQFLAELLVATILVVVLTKALTRYINIKG
ncbi:ECF transporter S component [Peptococcus simiae]|uniref:ECF transporter S component n=1 Tax=Peptococcus simiae TaxID=1643805 RepID=A0ABW9GZG8_9FIRM